MAFEKVVQYLNNTYTNKMTSNFLFGAVTNLKPLKIKVDGLPELIEKQLILSDNVKELKIKLEGHTHTVDGQETSKELKEIKIKEGLKQGDKVFIIQSNDKQLFYIKEIIKDDSNS